MQESFNFNIAALSNLALENVTWFTQTCEKNNFMKKQFEFIHTIITKINNSPTAKGTAYGKD